MNNLIFQPRYSYRASMDSFPSYYNIADIVDDKPAEIATDIEVTHYHGDYFGLMNKNDLSKHCSYHADPKTARWLRFHIEVKSHIQYVEYGENYSKAMFRVVDKE